MAVAEPQTTPLIGGLLVLTLAPEGFALALIARGEPGLAATLHLAAVACAACAGWAAVSAPRRRGAQLFSAAIVLALPLVGALGLACVVVPAWRRSRPLRHGPVVELELPDALRDDPAAAVRSSAGPGRSLLEVASSPPLRVEALLCLRRMESHRVVPLLRLAFNDPSEEVRLLAFAILERREKSLRERLRRRFAELGEAGSRSERERGKLHQIIAQDHWELVHGGFANGDTELRLLAAAAEHAERAFGLGQQGPAALLASRIALRQRDAERAERWLSRAEQAGVALGTTAPLRAEAAFIAARFADVAAAFGRAPRGQLRRAGIAPLVEFWTGEEHR
jgi:hypothetical protein